MHYLPPQILHGAHRATDAEIQDAAAFVEAQSQQYAAGDHLHPWADLAHVLFNVKEFIFVE